MNAHPPISLPVGKRTKPALRRWAALSFRVAFALVVGLLLSVEHAHSQPVSMTEAQIKAAGIVTVKPEALGTFGGSIDLNGFLVPSRTGMVAVASLEPATVAEVLKNNLAEVKQGEALLRLNSEAWLRYQQEHLQNTVALNIARQAQARDQSLLNDGLIAQRRYTETQGQFSMASAAQQGSRQRLRLIGASESEVAQLERTGKLSASLVLRAPFSGSVSGMAWTPGQQVPAGATLFQLAKTGEFELQLNASTTQARLIKPGQVVRFKACNGKVLPLGLVSGVSSELTPGSQGIAVRVGLKKAASDLQCFKLNQVVTASVQVDASDAAPTSELKVPNSALVYVGNQAYVFARTASGFQAVKVAARRLDAVAYAIHQQEGANPGVLGLSTQIASSGTVLLKGALQGLGTE